jgi:hypothetical protein
MPRVKRNGKIFVGGAFRRSKKNMAMLIEVPFRPAKSVLPKNGRRKALQR